jgi:hypothetical protein
MGCGNSVMTYSRFYSLDKRGKVSTAPTVLKCRDDDEALLQGQNLVGDFPFEIRGPGPPGRYAWPEKFGLEQ